MIVKRDIFFSVVVANPFLFTMFFSFGTYFYLVPVPLHSEKNQRIITMNKTFRNLKQIGRTM